MVWSDREAGSKWSGLMGWVQVVWSDRGLSPSGLV